MWRALALAGAALNVSLAFAMALRPPTINPTDFYTFLDSARAYLAGLNPYAVPLRLGMGHNLNPPATLILFLPFAPLEEHAAFLAWTAINVLLFAVAAWRLSLLTRVSLAWILAGLFLSQGTFAALQLGHFTPLLLLLFTEAWAADRDDYPLRAGVLLGFLMALKLFLGVFFIYAIWRRSRPMVVGILLGASAIVLTGLGLTGLAGYRAWYEVLSGVTWTAQRSNGSILGLLSRLFTDQLERATPLVVDASWVRPLWWVFGVPVVLGATAVVRRALNRDHQWLTITTAALLISPLGWIYYAPIVAGPWIGYWRTTSPQSRIALWLSYLWLCVPYTVMDITWGKLGTTIVACAYTWGLLTLFFACLWPPEHLGTSQS
jgi:hypothetical protein